MFSYSQRKKELEYEKAQNSKNIKFTNELLQKTHKNKKIEYSKLLLVSSNIESREELINIIESEIEYIDDQIKMHYDIIFGLESDLSMYKNEYHKMIYAAFKSDSKYDKLLFLFASESFNKAFQRLKYLSQYTKSRKYHIIKINDTKNLISEEIVQLEVIKSEKRNLFLDKKIENQKLLAEKQLRSSIIKSLTVKEKSLKSKLRKQQKIAAKIQAEIRKIIKEEARLAAAKLKTNSNSFFQLTPEEQILAKVFEQNKNKLPWPTIRGVITSSFGEHNHPVLKGVIIRNDGVDITTNTNAKVRSVYEGKVSRVFAIPGAQKTVIIRHGNYLTVYSNLKQVFVKQGDKIITKQDIGIAFTDEDDNRTVIQFQIWKENQKLNPALWLAKLRNE